MTNDSTAYGNFVVVSTVAVIVALFLGFMLYGPEAVSRDELPAFCADEITKDMTQEESVSCFGGTVSP